MTKKIYLAGVMTFLEKKGRRAETKIWRDRIKEEAPFFQYFDPTIYDKNTKVTDETIVKQNLLYLRECDIIVVNVHLLEKSLGTMFELTTGFLQHKTVIALDEQREYTKLPAHAKCCIDIRFRTIEELCSFLNTTFQQ